MNTFVLVHGGKVSAETWNSTVGKEEYSPATRLGEKLWKGCKKFLESKQCKVFTPELEDENKVGLSRHIQQIVEIIGDNSLSSVILVGHSYGGMVITGAAARVPNQIAKLVYVDAALPFPGESLCDLLTKGGLKPEEVFEGMLPRAYAEKIKFDQMQTENIAKTYLRCTKSDFLSVTQIAFERIHKNVAGWDYREMKCGHLPMAENPQAFNDILLGLSIK